MRKQINIRLPEHTRKQLDDLVETTGLTITQLIILAVSDYYSRYLRGKVK